MTRGMELRNIIFKEILAQDGVILDVATTRGGHQQVRCAIAGEPMRFIYATSPSDVRVLKNMRGFVRRRAKAARKRAEGNTTEGVRACHSTVKIKDHREFEKRVRKTGKLTGNDQLHLIWTVSFEEDPVTHDVIDTMFYHFMLLDPNNRRILLGGGEPSYNASLEQVEAFLTTLATVYDDNGEVDHAALKAAESAALALV